MKQLLLVTEGGVLNHFACLSLSSVLVCNLAVKLRSCKGCTSCSGSLCVSLQMKYEEIGKVMKAFRNSSLDAFRGE